MIFRVEEPNFLSNAYLVTDPDSKKGVLIDSNGVTEPLLELIDREEIEITQILLTHHHYDHVLGVEQTAERYGIPVLAHPRCAELVDAVTDTLQDGAVVETGGLRFEAIYTPGHCGDHIAFNLNQTDLFTADLLFRGTVGGTGAPGATGLDDLRRSIMERVMALDRSIRIHPGHRAPSTLAAEWESNPFVRLWRGLESFAEEPVSVGPPNAETRRAATLLLWAPDYDGGNKALIRFADDGTETITGGSQIKRESA